MANDNGSAFPYSADGRTYIGRLFEPSDPSPRTLIILLPDWRGQSALAHDHAAFLTDLGCRVVVADLYGDGFAPASPEEVGPLVQRLINSRQEGVRAVAACAAALRRTNNIAAPLVCLGYSAGGMVALDFGRSGGDVDGIILCTALLKTADVGMATRITAPVLILQGTQDQVSPMETISAVVAEMDAAHNDVCFVLFSQTHHAFDNPEAGTDPTARLVYSASSAQRARDEIERFLTDLERQEI